MDMGSFAAAIEAHLALKRQNSRLEATMPLSRYRDESSSNVNAPESAPLIPSEASVDADAVTVSTTVGTAPRDDPSSWWNDRDLGFDWQPAERRS